MNTESLKPVRLQLRRRKGFKLASPNGLPIVVVSRPSKWGNPFYVGAFQCREVAVRRFKKMLKEGKTPPFNLADIRVELRGKNLACWCPVGQPCHADVLMQIANA